MCPTNTLGYSKSASVRDKWKFSEKWERLQKCPKLRVVVAIRIPGTPRNLQEVDGLGGVLLGALSWKIRSCPRKIAISQNTLLIPVQYYADNFRRPTNVFSRNNKRAEAPWSLCPRKFDPVREKSVVRTEVMTVHTGKLTGQIQSNWVLLWAKSENPSVEWLLNVNCGRQMKWRNVLEKYKVLKTSSINLWVATHSGSTAICQWFNNLSDCIYFGGPK